MFSWCFVDSESLVDVKVEILRLGGCDIHAAGADNLAYVLRKNQTLHALGSTGLHRAPQGSTGPHGFLGIPRNLGFFDIFLNLSGFLLRY